MKKEVELLMRFEALVSRYNEFTESERSVYGSLMDRDNIHYETRKNLNNFLEAGFDASQIAKMLSCQDVWNHYDKLKACGAKPQILRKKVANYLEYLKEWEDDSLANNIGLFYKRGVGFTRIMNCFYRDWGGCWKRFTREELLRQGIDEETINKYAGKYHIK
ncbi:hypothetical protein IJH24_03790 [Candidatus Saccharibacteria bacterium]|nr:hypothetical protein [Candidatus Saccharibacteria bacterium]